jgi:AcrR family transcriptional regulator
MIPDEIPNDLTFANVSLENLRLHAREVCDVIRLSSMYQRVNVGNSQAIVLELFNRLVRLEREREPERLARLAMWREHFADASRRLLSEGAALDTVTDAAVTYADAALAAYERKWGAK